MRRRDFIQGIGIAACTIRPLAVQAQQAQQATMPLVGFVNGASPSPKYFAAFREGLKDAGFVDGQNVAIEAKWAEGHYDKLPGHSWRADRSPCCSDRHHSWP